LSTSLQLAVIVAVSQNGVIGRGNALPWRLSADLRRFKRLTMGWPLIMGRQTFQSIGRVLPGRLNLVLSRQPEEAAWWPQEVAPEQGMMVPSWEMALERLHDKGVERAFVIGGRALFQLALPMAENLYLTRVLADVSGDVRMPEISWSDWKLVDRQEGLADAENEFPYLFEDYCRTGNAAGQVVG